MNSSPSVQDLKPLFEPADDDAGNHVLWIDQRGEVHLTLIPEGCDPVSFENSAASMQVRLETFCQGNGYVGTKAAEDDAHMGAIFRQLVDSWKPPFTNGETRYVDC